MAVARHRTQIVGPNNPNKRVSKNAWDEDHDIVLGADENFVTAAEKASLAGAIGLTYAEMVAAIAGGTLVPLRWYRMTDFQTSLTIPNTAEELFGPTEPLLFRAATTNSFFPEVYSTINTGDILQYEFTDTSGCAPAAGSVGRITRRTHIQRNLSVPIDWRTVKFRRWNSQPDGLGTYNVLTDNGNPYQDFYMFGNDSNAGTWYDTYFGNFGGLGNNVFIETSGHANQIGANAQNWTVGTNTEGSPGAFFSNVIGDGNTGDCVNGYSNNKAGTEHKAYCNGTCYNNVFGNNTEIHSASVEEFSYVTTGIDVYIEHNSVDQKFLYTQVGNGIWLVDDNMVSGCKFNINNDATAGYVTINLSGLGALNGETIDLPFTSTVQRTIDITGLTDLTLPDEWASVIKLTSTSDPKVETINGLPNFPYNQGINLTQARVLKLYPEAGLILTVDLGGRTVELNGTNGDNCTLVWDPRLSIVRMLNPEVY